MTRLFNFSAGPAVMPEEVLIQLQAEFLEWSSQGASILEAPHRSCTAAYLLEETVNLFRKLLKIPSHFHVLFMHGGARAQFAAVPMNLLGKSTKAIYLNTGYWSEAAAAEAKRYGAIEEIAFSAPPLKKGEASEASREICNWKLNVTNPLRVPSLTSCSPTLSVKGNKNVAYVHYCDNETISGIEFPEPPNVDNLPLIADMSSNILSRPIDWDKFGLVYAGMQKNIGPAGLAVVVVRDDLLNQAMAITPSILHYQTQVKHGSAYNTLPLFNIRAAQLVFNWLEKQGGVEGIARINQRKAEKVYAVIDKHGLYHNRVDPSCRSNMNITFSLPTQALEEQFIKEANEHNLINLAGHRSGGGIRVSLYNAMPEAAVDVLVEFMEIFPNSSPLQKGWRAGDGSFSPFCKGRVNKGVNMKSRVITIDGPGGSGKGTLASRLAQKLGWHYLDSGVLYRMLGLLALRQNVSPDDEAGLAALAEKMPVSFKPQASGQVSIYLDQEDVALAVRTEKAGDMASQVSRHAAVRAALLTLQRGFQQPPGLVTDGRDMGTVVFPEADLKIYLDASAEVRAERRLKQLQTMGVNATLADLVEELKNRDKRDQTRAVAPLVPAADAVIIDSSSSPIDVVLEQVFALAVKKLGVPS